MVSLGKYPAGEGQVCVTTRSALPVLQLRSREETRPLPPQCRCDSGRISGTSSFAAIVPPLSGRQPLDVERVDQSNRMQTSFAFLHRRSCPAQHFVRSLAKQAQVSGSFWVLWHFFKINFFAFHRSFRNRNSPSLDCQWTRTVPIPSRRTDKVCKSYIQAQLRECRDGTRFPTNLLEVKPGRAVWAVARNLKSANLV